MNSPCATSRLTESTARASDPGYRLQSERSDTVAIYFTAPAVMPWISFSEKKT